MSLTSKIRVAVLRGGPSSEYDVSLQTGASVLKHLPDKYHGLDVLIDKSGIWHLGGMPKSPSSVLSQVDVVWNGLHGTYGEDGQVQQILQTHAVPFTGSKSFASSVGMNKHMAKEIFVSHHLKTPQYVVIRSTDDVHERAHTLFQTFVMPAIVKPSSAGSSVGVALVSSLGELVEAVERAREHSPSVVVEEYITGKEATCGVVEGLRGEVLHALLPVEIRTQQNIFNYDEKYGGQAEEVCPGNFSQAEKKMIEDYARRAHKVLGLRHYSRSDFIVSPKRGVYILETNSLPGLTDQSLLPKALAAGGTTMPYFLDHVLTLALR